MVITRCSRTTRQSSGSRSTGWLTIWALVIDLETHRGTCTETPEKTWRIAEVYQQETSTPIRLTFDFSHFAIVKHTTPPYAEHLLNSPLLERPDLLRHSRQIHLRPFNAHHCEIPVTDGQGQIGDLATPWFEFVEEILRTWAENAGGEGGPLWVCPELGAMTSGYWLPSFPDPWQDALVVKREVSRIWDEQSRKLS